MRKMDLALQRKRRNQKKHRDWSVVFFLWNFTLLIHSSLSLLSKYTELMFESTQHNQTRRKKTDLLTHLLGLIISTVSVLHTHFGRCFGLTFEPRWLRATYSPFFHKMVERREKKNTITLKVFSALHWMKLHITLSLNSSTSAIGLCDVKASCILCVCVQHVESWAYILHNSRTLLAKQLDMIEWSSEIR